MDDASKTNEQLIAELRALRALVEAHSAGRSDAEKRTQHMLENVRAVIAEIDSTGRITYVSPNAREIFGKSASDMVGQPSFRLIHPDDRARMREALENLLRTGESSNPVYRMQRGSDDWIWCEASGRTYVAADGGQRTVMLLENVSERVAREEALRESEERFRSMAENISDVVLEFDETGRLLFASPNLQSLAGSKPVDTSTLTVDWAEAAAAEAAAKDEGHDLIGGFQEILARGEKTSVNRFTIDGRDRWLESRARTYQRADGSRRVVILVHDVTQRHVAERELAESEERYRLVTDMSRDLISEMDVDGNLVYASQTLEEVLGYPVAELVGRSPFFLVHPDDVDAIRDAYVEAVEKERPVSFPPYRARHRDGRWLWFEGIGRPFRRGDELRLLGCGREITQRIAHERERRELEERVQQAQRLEGLGVMAGGIAHDFNNLLTPILGDASLALMDVPPGSPARPRIQKIQKAAHRAAALTNQMLAYAGKGPLLVESLDLNRLVRETAELLESAVASRATLRYEFEDALPSVEADSAQLTQVVMNLIQNSSDAVADGEGGEVVVRTGCVDASELLPSQTILGNELRDGSYVYFEVADTGCGMDAETQARIFDPFFTTKFTGRGLGLAAVLGIVRGHRGAMELESEVGRGTRFRVLFPASESVPEAAAAPPSLDDWRAEGTVLIVDDDEGVRDVMADTLTRCGLDVLAAGEGLEGIELFRRHADEIRLVLLDRTMPSISGEEAFDEIRRIRKNARVVLVSGYSQERAAEQFGSRRLSGFLQKPFLPETLIDKVRQLLDAPD